MLLCHSKNPSHLKEEGKGSWHISCLTRISSRCVWLLSCLGCEMNGASADRGGRCSGKLRSSRSRSWQESSSRSRRSFSSIQLFSWARLSNFSCRKSLVLSYSRFCVRCSLHTGQSLAQAWRSGIVESGRGMNLLVGEGCDSVLVTLVLYLSLLLMNASVLQQRLHLFFSQPRLLLQLSLQRLHLDSCNNSSQSTHSKLFKISTYSIKIFILHKKIN